MDKSWEADWITDRAFHGLTPRPIFFRENEELELKKHREDLKNRHMFVRREFSIEKPFDTAELDITADDYYRLYINGCYVGQGPAPGYYFHYYYNRYDLSEHLREGVNVIAVHVYYQGLVNRSFVSGDYRQGMIAELKLDGRVFTGTDASWKYMVTGAYRGETTGYKTQYLENIDSRCYPHGWREAGFRDQNWKSAWIDITDDHRLFLQPTPPPAVYKVVPQSVVELKEGLYLVDFGREIVGRFDIRAAGEAGQQVEIRCGEELDGEGRVRHEMRSGVTYDETWTLSGRKEESPKFFDYKAFRYVEVEGPAEALEPGSFSAEVQHYPLDECCSHFHSDHQLLNQIWKICRNGVQYGTQNKYMDCPTREKGQYLGDNTVITHSHLYLSGDLRLYRKSLLDFAHSSFVCPGLMSVSPSGLMQEIADYSLQWPLQLYRYFQHSGDYDFLEQMQPVAEGILDYFESYRRGDGLLSRVDGKWNLVDWPENLRDSYDFGPEGEGEKSCHSVLNAFYFGALQDINRIRAELGRGRREDLSSLRDAFLAAFYDRRKGLFVDSVNSDHSSLHANILPLYFGLAPADAEEGIISLVRKKGLNCGVYMAYFVLKALARGGEYRLLYELLTSHSEHSWGNMIAEGATTCFEAWGKDQKWNTSLCHPWASAPVPVIVEDIAGLKPAVPGWEKFSFEPRIPKELERFELEITVKTGKIRVESKNGTITITAPVEMVKGNDT